MVDGWPFPVNLDDDWRRRCSEVATLLLASPHYACFVVDAPEQGTSDESGVASPRLASCVTASIEQHLPGPDGSGRSAYVGDMCTVPEHRGQGMGAALLDAALQWCREQEAGWVSLFSTESGNALYRKAGFSENGPFEHLSMGL